MFRLAPVLLALGAAIIAITTSLANARGAFNGRVPIAPYACVYGCAALAFIVAGILFYGQDRQKPMLSIIREFIKTGHSCYVSPRTPHVADELFQPLSVTPQLLTLRVNRNQGQTTIPVQRVQELLPATGYRTLIVDGRLQCLTQLKKWEFFPEPPQSVYGVGKLTDLGEQRVQAITRGMEEEGLQVGWLIASNLERFIRAGWQIFYDDDGRYLFVGNPKSILIAGKKLPEKEANRRTKPH